jgi:hypothetical protein
MDLIVKGLGARLFLHPGKGKTSTVLKAFTILQRAGIVDHLLVLAPLRVITTSWPSQLDYWEDFAHLSYTLVHGNRAKAMDEVRDVYLMNVEGLLSKQWAPTSALNPIAESFLSRGRFMLAIDESTKMKNANSRRFKVLKRYLHKFSHRTIMTGTPKPNKLEDLFAQCYLTDTGKDLGQYITHFRRQYMVPDSSGFGYAAQPGAMERVAAKIAPTTLQLEYEEAVPSQVIPIWLPMPPDAMKQYKELEKEFLTSIEGQLVMAPNSGVLYGKLRQIAQGAIYDAEKNVIEVHTAKLDALESLLEELDGEPAFCLIQFRHDTARIRGRLGYDVPCIASGTSAAKGAEFAAAFSHGAIPLLLGHPQSVAHGIDGLQNACNNLIWFGQDASYENNYQSHLRIIRHGSKAEQVFIYRIMMDCGIERAILAAVSGKQQSEEEFLTTLRSYMTA